MSEDNKSLKEANNIVAEIFKERKRQILEEGWSKEHDDEHDLCELANAAACYAAPEQTIYLKTKIKGTNKTVYRDLWPWDDEWDKRDKHPRIKQLIIAGALIVAEIERLQRLERLNGVENG